MTRKVEVTRSKRAGKKLQAKFEDGPTVHFGASGMSDFTRNKDPGRRKQYLARHRANENWKDEESAGFWSRYLLWEKPTLRAAAEALRQRGLDVKLNV